MRWNLWAVCRIWFPLLLKGVLAAAARLVYYTRARPMGPRPTACTRVASESPNRYPARYTPDSPSNTGPAWLSTPPSPPPYSNLLASLHWTFPFLCFISLSSEEKPFMCEWDIATRRGRHAPPCHPSDATEKKEQSCKHFLEHYSNLFLIHSIPLLLVRWSENR